MVNENHLRQSHNSFTVVANCLTCKEVGGRVKLFECSMIENYNQQRFFSSSDHIAIHIQSF